MGKEIAALKPEATQAGSLVTEDSGFAQLRKLFVWELKLLLATSEL